MEYNKLIEKNWVVRMELQFMDSMQDRQKEELSTWSFNSDLFQNFPSTEIRRCRRPNVKYLWKVNYL